jgi:hypothetical protein
MFHGRWLSSGAPFQVPMMTGWEQDVVTKRWRPSVSRAEPLVRRDRRRGGEPRGRLPATLLAVDDACWSCRAPVRAIVGVLVDRALTEDGSGFLALATVDRILLAVLEEGALAERGIGPLRHRHSPGVQGGYVSNGCPECDALVGRFRVDDLLAEHLALGGALADLAVDITVDLLADGVWRRAPRMR